MAQFCVFFVFVHLNQQMTTSLDLSDNERDNVAQAPSSQVPNSESHQQAINYTSLAATAAAVAASGGVKSNVSEQEQQQSLSSTETLLRNIQSLLTVAADNARQQERQISYEKGKRDERSRVFFFF